jgi:hypothetical protein
MALGGARHTNVPMAATVAYATIGIYYSAVTSEADTFISPSVNFFTTSLELF